MPRSATDLPSGAGPLAGLRMLDLGNMIAAPTAACLLGDLGADVVKVEHPVHGDDLRNWPPMKEGRSLWWKVTNRNKILITLDLSMSRGQALVRRMLPRFDVLLENFRPGTMERWNLGYDELSRIHPRIIMVRVSGYGQTGPYAKRPGYGTIAEAMSGVPSFTGHPDKPPTFSAFPLVDALAGLFAATAALAAVHERDIGASGCGQVIDVSLFEALFRLADSQVIGFDQLGIVKRRNGNRMDEDSPRNSYRTSDGKYVAISAGSQKTFARLSAAMGMSGLNEDPRFCSTVKRIENADVLDQIVAAWFERLPLGDVMARLEEADAVAGPVYDVRRIFDDPQFAAREDIVSVADEDFGSVRMQGVVPKLSRTPGSVRHAGRSLGHDNAEFYGRTLGLTDGEIEALRQEGVI